MTVNNGDILKLTAEFTLADGTIVQNVYHLIATLLAPAADALITAAVETWIEAAYAQILQDVLSTVTVNTFTLDKIAWNVDKWEVIANIGLFVPTIVFTGTGDGLPNQVSPFALFETSRPKSNGRKFMFAYTEATTIGSVLQSGQLTRLAGYATKVLDTIVIAALENLVAGVPRVAVEVFLPFTLGVVTNIVGTQRRRRPGVGI